MRNTKDAQYGIAPRPHSVSSVSLNPLISDYDGGQSQNPTEMTKEADGIKNQKIKAGIMNKYNMIKYLHEGNKLLQFLRT
jgi:hypothetical protein